MEIQNSQKTLEKNQKKSKKNQKKQSKHNQKKTNPWLFPENPKNPGFDSFLFFFDYFLIFFDSFWWKSWKSKNRKKP